MTETTSDRASADGSHDVIVVGARCAGAATAMLLARQGVDVLVVDRATFPSDTLSTHAISRGGIVQLARWGLLDSVVGSGAPEVRTVSFHSHEGTVVRRSVQRSAGVDLLLAPRRHVLDAILTSAAVAAGARLETGVTVTDVVRDDTGRVQGVVARDAAGRPRRFVAKIVVGADGVRSRIARAVGAGMADERSSLGATLYAYVTGLDAEGFEFHVGPRGIAGVFPTHGAEANVWVCFPADDAGGTPLDRPATFRRLLRRTAPALAERVAAARITSPVRGTVRCPNQIRAAVGPGWALVGDAAYHRDPITGHGITDAFRDAELLARRLVQALADPAAETGALAAYDAERRRALAPIFDVTCQLATYPPVDEFVALHKELGVLVAAEAEWLASLPQVGARALAAA